MELKRITASHVCGILPESWKNFATLRSEWCFCIVRANMAHQLYTSDMSWAVREGSKMENHCLSEASSRSHK